MHEQGGQLGERLGIIRPQPSGPFVAGGCLVAAAEGERVSSTNELAAYYRINPATAAKGINLLADDGLLEKRRGIGMFVAAGARQRLLAQRREHFVERYVRPLLTEATRLGIDSGELIAVIKECGREQSSDSRGGVAV